MSKLFYTESGHSIPWFGEEVTTFRRVRKLLPLETTASPATLYVLARTYKDSRTPLRISVNGTELAPVDPYPLDWYRWYPITLSQRVWN